MRRLSLGAEIEDGGVHFRVWAPKCKHVAVLIGSNPYPLKHEGNGFFSNLIPEAKEHTLYQYILDDADPLPDPASRFQPSGPHGPSQVINPNNFKWTDHAWKGPEKKAILYEMHIGTFTEEGTWRAAATKLPHLVELGIDIIEMMPVNEFPGRFNWGYDGVDLYAPTHNYGMPDDLRAFINQAHVLGLAVILDVVYNHFGPDGNYLAKFSDYFFKKENNEWGQYINFDGEESRWTRQFFIENAGYWIDEFHFDGLRIDACHSIEDKSNPHVLLEISRKVREKGKGKKTFVVAENEKQQAHFVLSEEQGGYELDGVFNEDFHHTAFVRLVGRNEAYFSDYIGNAYEFVSSLKYNFLYQGQWYSWQKKKRGSCALDIPHYHFINFLENHDQIANTGSAERLYQSCHPRMYRALTALLLLSPQAPLLFQGVEFGSSAPFYYFCEHKKELAEQIYNGRIEFVSQFSSINHDEVIAAIPRPDDEKTFLRSKLKWAEKEKNLEFFHLHKDLIEMRKKDPVFSQLNACKIDGIPLTVDFFLIRYFSRYGERLILINLGVDFTIFPASEPLLAPPTEHEWKSMWSSELPKYGGFGYQKIPDKGNWKITGHSATVLYPEKIGNSGNMV